MDKGLAYGGPSATRRACIAHVGDWGGFRHLNVIEVCGAGASLACLHHTQDASIALWLVLLAYTSIRFQRSLALNAHRRPDSSAT
ncbi:hypothetical protein ACET3X_003981 [Alternaria dauci]|uniref:Uncharacterized protein n=1 Tax=Alternaria dauci TaxID=48095 RepID=A0ABR3UMW6_9PLEO